MQFIKTHWISLVCSVATIVFVTIAVLGMMSTTVVSEMNEHVKEIGAREIAALKADPKNQKIIQAEEDKGREFEAEYQATLQAAHEINRRAPLMDGVFPTPARRSTPFEFVQAYRQALTRLPIELIAGTLPTPDEIADEQQNVADLLALEAEQAEEGGGKAPAITRQAVRRGGRTATPTYDPGSTMIGGGEGMLRGGGGRRTAMVGPRGGMGRMSSARSGDAPKYDPWFRATVTKAKSIRCYIDPPTFHVSPIVEVTSAPRPEDMWFAQVSLWIQQDVVAAIAALNKAAAQQVTRGEAYVEQMPVKRLEVLRVLGYQMPGGLLAFPGSEGAGDTGGSFTGQTCNDQYDVVRFVLVAVVDQRDVLQLIDRITRQNFYQCTGASYSAVGPADAQQGYRYGTEPVVRVRLEFEGYMARAVYKPLMPAEIRTLLKADQDEG